MASDANEGAPVRLSMRERLQVVYDRLAAAVPVRTADEALALVCSTLEAVEDEFSGVPKVDSPGKDTGGRMYTPLPELTCRLANGTIKAKTKGHVLHCRADGAIAMWSKSGVREFLKAGGGR